MEENLFLISYGEIALKGDNRPFFERILVQRIKQALGRFEKYKIQRTHGRIYCFVIGPEEDVINALKKTPATTTYIHIGNVMFISPFLSAFVTVYAFILIIRRKTNKFPIEKHAF